MTELLLEVSDLRVSFGAARALDGVSLAVPKATAFGLIGPNGAGKSTFIDAVAGYLPRATGEVRFLGKPISGLRPHERARHGLARTFQTLELFEDLTVRENLLVAAQRRTLRGSLLDLVRRPGKGPVAAAERALDILELSDVAGVLPDALSHGHRNLVSVGRALAAEPRLLLLDEPAAGLDSHESAELGRRLRRIVDQGITLLLVDHDMGLVLNVCDRIHVLDFGRTIAEGTPDEIRQHPAVLAAYLGEQMPAGEGASAP